MDFLFLAKEDEDEVVVRRPRNQSDGVFEVEAQVPGETVRVVNCQFAARGDRQVVTVVGILGALEVDRVCEVHFII